MRRDDYSTNVSSLVSLNDLPAWAVYNVGLMTIKQFSMGLNPMLVPHDSPIAIT